MNRKTLILVIGALVVVFLTFLFIARTISMQNLPTPVLEYSIVKTEYVNQSGQYILILGMRNLQDDTVIVENVLVNGEQVDFEKAVFSGNADLRNGALAIPGGGQANIRIYINSEETRPNTATYHAPAINKLYSHGDNLNIIIKYNGRVDKLETKLP